MTETFCQLTKFFEFHISNTCPIYVGSRARARAEKGKFNVYTILFQLPTIA
jgi:hypothetical protein